MDDRRPGLSIWLNCGVVPPPKPAGPVTRDGNALMGAFASVFATPTRMGDQESLEAGGALAEQELKRRRLR